MQAEQRRTQHGHERRDLRIHVREVGHQQSEACNQQGKGEHEGETAHQGDAHAQHAHGHEEHSFKTVAHRHETSQIPAESKPQCHANEGRDQCTTQRHVEPAAAKTTHQQAKCQKAQRETIHEGDFHGGDAIVDDFGRDTPVRQACSTIGIGQWVDERALVEHHNQPHFLVGVLNGARQRRGRIALGRHEALQTVFAAGIELRHRGIVAHYAQPLAQCGTLDAHHRHILPLGGIIDPREQYLVGSETAKRRAPADFLAEIHR